MSARDDAYHWLRPDTDVGPRVGIPEPLAALDLRRGAWLDRAPPAPLLFTLDGGAGAKGTAPPPHWIGEQVPLVSELFLTTLRRAGADNFQTFPALVRNGKTAEPTPGHAIFNVIGAVDGSDPEASVGKVLIEEDPGPKLVAYSQLVLASARTRDLDMFRLADSPTTLLVHDRVMRALAAATPPEGWGFTALEIELR